MNMTLRPYVHGTDFDKIKNWSADRRTHAMWCAGRFPYPLEKESFETVLREHSERCGDAPFIAVGEDRNAVGFFCFSLNRDTNEGMLKFVIVDPALRGKGLGKAMLRLALGYAFDTAGADSVRLSVFAQNAGACRCYESVGFTETRTEAGAFGYDGELWDRRVMTISYIQFGDRPEQNNGGNEEK